MRIFIVCSSSFYGEVENIAQKLKKQNHSINYPSSYDDPLTSEKWNNMTHDEKIKFKEKFLKEDKTNVKNADAILVLNFEKNGQKNYIGGATFLEMYNAWEMGKKIFLFNPIPDNILKDEIVGFNPIIIKGDLSKIGGNLR